MTSRPVKIKRAHRPTKLPTRYPHVLVLASRYDYASDYVIARLRANKVPYLRLNSEDLPALKLTLDPTHKILEIIDERARHLVTDTTLRSVWFRRPVFLREVKDTDCSPQDQLFKSYWLTFFRNLTLFRNCRWMNHPAATYQAENKAFQLSVAAEVGFDIPETLITNTTASIGRLAGVEGLVAVKGLDTVLIRSSSHERFGYTSFTHLDDFEKYDLSAAPTIFQRALMKKVDFRITVIGHRVFPVSISHSGTGIHGDWRLHKGSAAYRSANIPHLIAERCSQMVRTLGLSFGAIDLAYQEGRYYFLEINPTGEWAWLVHQAKLPIDTSIADFLSV